MIKDDFNVSWYEVSATNTSLFDRSIVPVCPFNSFQSIFWNGWDPAGILKNLTPELVRFSQSTTQHGCDGGRDNRVTGGGRLPPAVVHVTSHTGCI